MSFLNTCVDAILHLDRYLNVIIQNYGMWTYGLLFIVIFGETGLVFTPFLPGDSILFATGALAASGTLHVFALFFIYLIAAIVGDTANYHIGKKIGNGILEKDNVRFIKKEYLTKAQNFYTKYGSMTIVLGRFMPIIRTFVPFVAGIGKMKYSNFITYNILGGFLWVTLMLGGGYFFGGLPFIRNHFSLVVIVIIAMSAIPAIIAFINGKRHTGKLEEDIN